MQNSDWAEHFRGLYNRACERYRTGAHSPDRVFIPEEVAALSHWGCNAQEMFDLVEDNCRFGEPSFETALLITAVRRDYFLYVQQRQPSGHRVDMDALPGKEEAVDGIAWLPRIIQKARAKLRGEMPPDLMYCCGGDRAFLRSVDIHPADFLREVWAAGENDRRVVDFVKRHRSVRGVESR
jgi:Domain of unknown function (DUF5069)